MALGGRGDVLVALVDHLHRPLRLQRQQRRVPGDERRIVFLPAESAARDHLDDGELIVGDVQQLLQRLVDVERALHRAVDGDAAVRARDGADRLRLDVHLLLVADLVRAFDDLVRAGERLAQPVRRLLDVILLERLLRLQRIEKWPQRLDFEPDVLQRLFELFPILAGQQRHRLFAMADEVVRQHRLVHLDERDDVLAGDVGGGDPGDPGPVVSGIEVDLQQLRVGHFGADGGAPELAVEGEIVEVARPAAHFVRAVLARGRAADGRPLFVQLLHAFLSTTDVGVVASEGALAGRVGGRRIAACDRSAPSPLSPV
jgi:hypothetical protein